MEQGEGKFPWAGAAQRLNVALQREYAESFEASAIGGLREETLRGYLRQLRWLARIERMSPGLCARAVLEAKLL